MWLIPFKGRNHSGCYAQNFLWRKDNIYIMDNHRAALWCWFQHMSANETINFLHIDRHTDTLQSKLEEWTTLCPDLWTIELEEYLDIKHEGDTPLFRWDNYASIFLDKYKHQINKCIFVTHKEGDAPNFKPVQQSDIWNLPGNLDYWLEEGCDKWIVNLDLDYFFYNSDFGIFSTLLSEEYIEQIFYSIKKQLLDNRILCFTMCLSPECCGSWEASEKICQKASDILGIDFSLP